MLQRHWFRFIVAALIAGAGFAAASGARAEAVLPPEVSNVFASGISANSVQLNATITTNLQNTQVAFAYKTASASSYDTLGMVSLPGGPGQDPTSMNLGGLACATDYRFTVSATSIGGTTTSAPVGFTTDACSTSLPRVTVTSTGVQRAGATISINADVTGGTGSIRYDFDFDDNGTFERSGSQSRLDVTYPGRFDGNVTVRVVDGAGASDSGTVHITTDAPNLAASVTGAATQVCGDGDAQPEPGERFGLPVRIVNNGTAATQDGYALFNSIDSSSVAPGGPPTTITETRLLVDTPAVAVGALAPGAGIDAMVQFELAPTTPCGASTALAFGGGVDSAGSSAGSTATLAAVAVPAQCQVFAGCPKSKAFAAPRQGLYYNPARSGNGLSNFIIPNGDGSQTYFGAWFTANADRSPTWYIIQGNVLGGAVKALIYSFKRDLASPTFRVTRTEVGKAVIVQLDGEHALLAWSLGTRQGAEQMQFFTTGAAPSPNRTGAWYNTTESGWGQVIHEFVASGTPNTFTVDYIYDGAGDPRWVIAQNSTAGFAAATAHATFAVQCPGCPWIADWASLPLAAGTGSVTFSGATSGTTTTSYALPAPLSGTWTRNALPIQLLTVPQ